MEIRIKHIGSTSGKTSNELLNRKYEGDFGSIFKELCSLCDWSIETICIDGSYRLNYLKSNDINDIEKLDYKLDGFTHILRFYK